MKSTKNYSSGQAFKRGVIFLFHYFHDLSLFVPFHWTFFLSFNIFVYFLLIFEMWVFFFPSSVWTLLACVSRNPKLSRNIYGPQLRWSVWFITLLSFIYPCFSVLLWNLSRGVNVNTFLYHMMFLEATVCIDLLQPLFVYCDWLFVFCLYVAPRPLI